MKRVLLTTVLAVVVFAYPALGQPASRTKIFVFHTDEFWLNLHHFLYVLGRAQNKTRDSSRSAVVNAPNDQEQGLAKLTDAGRATGRGAVSFFAKDLRKKDNVFDEPLPAITNALAQAGAAKSLAGTKVDSAIVSVLARAAPVYRKAWWSAHHGANVAWQLTIQKLVDQHGRAILEFITKAYQMSWNPAGFHVHLSGYTNWAGAYSTTAELLVLSSLAEDIRGVYGLETIFHEGMHQWDQQVFEVLSEQRSICGEVWRLAKRNRGLQNTTRRNLETIFRWARHARRSARRLNQANRYRNQVSFLAAVFRTAERRRGG